MAIRELEDDDRCKSELRTHGKEAILEGYFQAQLWGTPEQIIEKYRQRVALSGGHHEVLTFSYGAMPYDRVEASMRLFAKAVLPEMRAIESEMPIAA